MRHKTTLLIFGLAFATVVVGLYWILILRNDDGRILPDIGDVTKVECRQRKSLGDLFPIVPMGNLPTKEYHNLRGFFEPAEIWQNVNKVEVEDPVILITLFCADNSTRVISCYWLGSGPLIFDVDGKKYSRRFNRDRDGDSAYPDEFFGLANYLRGVFEPAAK